MTETPDSIAATQFAEVWQAVGDELIADLARAERLSPAAAAEEYRKIFDRLDAAEANCMAAMRLGPPRA